MPAGIAAGVSRTTYLKKNFSRYRLRPRAATGHALIRNGDRLVFI